MAVTVPDIRTQRAIKRVLCMPKRSTFVRCPSKDMVIIRKLEKQGDYTHRARGHVCEKCRCRHTAGHGTKGDFYGLGETGHYGVGFCQRHSRGRNAAMARTFAVNHMKSLQKLGKAQHAEDDYEIIVRSDALEAQENKEVRQGIELVQDTLSEFRRSCTTGNNGTATSLTESSKRGAVTMSDKTRMELACKLATTIATLAKDKYTLEAGDYIHVDELKLRIPQMIALAYRFIQNDADKEKFIDEFKNIWENARTGVK